MHNSMKYQDTCWTDGHYNAPKRRCRPAGQRTET